MSQQPLAGQFRRPSKALTALMVVIACLWVMFSLAINWGGSGRAVFALLAGDSAALFRGQIWRLVSASLMHDPNQPTHPLFVLLMLYFFVPALEERWGARRLFAFLFGCAAFAFAVESSLHVLSPSLANASWYGGMVMGDAAMVAWAFANRSAVIRLFFVLPIKPLVMIALLVAWHVVLVVTHSSGPEGLFAPFGAILAGWLFCDSGPGRRAYLRLKLRFLERQIKTVAKPSKKARRAAPHLRVIRGGSDDDPDDRMLH